EHRLLRDAVELLLGLHHRRRHGEGLEVGLERARLDTVGEPAPGGGDEPGAERVRPLRGKVEARLLGDLADGLGPQTTVEVVVEEALGQGPDLFFVDAHTATLSVRRPDAWITGSPRARQPAPRQAARPRRPRSPP